MGISNSVNYPCGFDPGCGVTQVAPAFFIPRNMRTYVYIDGFNLYYRALKGTPYKWSNLKALFIQPLNPQNKIQAIKYFTALVSGKIDPNQRIRKGVLAKSQLPDPIPGTSIRKPKTW